MTELFDKFTEIISKNQREWANLVENYATSHDTLDTKLFCDRFFSFETVHYHGMKGVDDYTDMTVVFYLTDGNIKEYYGMHGWNTSFDCSVESNEIFPVKKNTRTITIEEWVRND